MKVIKKILIVPYKIMQKIKSFMHCMISLVFISRNKIRVKNKINKREKLNVVFIIQYIPGWNKLEPIYSRMKQDDRFNPIIVCVPLNIQNNKLLDYNNDIYEYFVAHGYQPQNALKENGGWINLKDFEPDYVFHSRPYNHFMPKCYTSAVIRKYALICNVLYGANTTENGQSVTINKDYFRDVFCYFAFDRLEKLFFEKRFRIGTKLNIQKCIPDGAIGLEQMLKSRVEKTENKFSKTVLWTPRWSTDPFIGGSNFFSYKELMVDLVRKYPSVLFVFRPHPLMFGNFIQTGEMTEQEVADFKKYCEITPNLILDETKEYSNTFWQSDFIITDASGVVPEYFVTKKPILYCHSAASFKYTEYAKEMISCCYEVKDGKDLLKYFNLLINNVDPKYEDRLNCINKNFKNVEDNSKNIIVYLSGLNREEIT